MRVAVPNFDSLPQWAKEAFESIVSRINNVFAKEHNGDGTHAAITATSIASTAGVTERGRTVAIGEWTSVTYSAANFTASAGTWTVDSADQSVFTYMQIGKTMWVDFIILGTDVSNAGVSLRITVPGGYTVAHSSRQMIRVTDAGAAQVVSYALMTAGTTYIECFATVASGGFAITAGDNTNVAGCVVLEVQ